MEGDETLTLTEEKVSHPSTLELARLTSKCLPFPVLEKSRKSYTLPKKGMSLRHHINQERSLNYLYEVDLARCCLALGLMKSLGF